MSESNLPLSFSFTWCGALQSPWTRELLRSLLGSGASGTLQVLSVEAEGFAASGIAEFEKQHHVEATKLKRVDPTTQERPILRSFSFGRSRLQPKQSSSLFQKRAGMAFLKASHKRSHRCGLGEKGLPWMVQSSLASSCFGPKVGALWSVRSAHGKLSTRLGCEVWWSN
ncbi:MAG: hypothetical protein H6727_02750 [Myxococcales bacterium]|nr:hypothetical protein [Myxococcales bacterium]